MNTHRIVQTILGGIFFALFLSVGFAGEPQFADVFAAGEGGFASIRIPAVVVTKTGVVLAMAEGRARETDQANNKLILKRSADGGRTWGPLQVIAEDGTNCLNNPCAVVDQGTGRVLVMFQSFPGNHHEFDGTLKPGLDGPDIERNYLIVSDDEGATWSKREDVTRTTKRPAVATTIASGPGIGIQLTRGDHRGRILIPFNEGPPGRWNNFAVYSDDGGKSWRCGQNVPGALLTDAKGKAHSQVNEVQMAELSDGSVLLNSRQFAGKKVRKTAVSRDGGETWSPVADAAELRDPSCMSSLFRYSFGDKAERNLLLFSHPDSSKRENGTIHASFDDGKTWPVKKILWPGSFAYSVLTRLPDGDAGCLFEADNYHRIVFARFPPAWMGEGVAPAAK